MNRLSSSLAKIGTRAALPVIATAVALLYTSYQLNLSFKKKKQSKYKEIPSPTEGCYPIVGHLLSLGSESEMEEKAIVWHKKYGPIIKLQFGVQPWFLIDDPELAHKIFVTNGAVVSGRPKTIFRFHYYSKDGQGGVAFSQPDMVWRRARTAVLATIAPQKIDQREDQIKNEASAFVNGLLNDIDNGLGEMFPLEHVQLATYNIALKISMGRRYDSYHDKEYRTILDLVEENFEFGYLEYEMPNFIPALYYPLHYLMGKSKMKSWVKRYNSVFSSLIKEAATIDDDNLVRAIHVSGTEIDHQELLILVSDLLGAGADTSIITLLWIIKFMSVLPEVQNKVAAEIADFTSSHGRLPNFNERDNFPYCICVIKEVMRLRPTVPFSVPHTTTADIEVDGYFIPKGHNIMPSMRSMHRNPNFFPDNPEKFMPERYMSNLKTMHAAANGKLEDRDHFNFGFGRRGCPGPYLAEMELFFMFTNLFHECAIEPASKNPPDMIGDKKGFFEVKFTRRSRQ